MVKRILIPTLILAGLTLACFSTKAGTRDTFSTQNVEVIPLMQEGPAVDPNSPREPVIVPINCSFDVQNEKLHFLFLFPMGDVTITLTEASAGVVSTDDYSTSSCFVAVPVPGYGTYDISVLLES